MLQTVLRSKPIAKNTAITLFEGVGYGLVLVAGDVADNKLNNDKESFKSASVLIPVLTAIATLVSTAVTQGKAERASKDLQLMSTPIAILKIGQVIQKKDLFGKIFKKKAKSLSDHFKNDNKEHGDTGQNSATGLVDVTMSDIGIAG